LVAGVPATVDGSGKDVKIEGVAVAVVCDKALRRLTKLKGVAGIAPSIPIRIVVGEEGIRTVRERTTTGRPRKGRSGSGGAGYDEQEQGWEHGMECSAIAARNCGEVACRMSLARMVRSVAISW
jgi:hypothetical protein